MENNFWKTKAGGLTLAFIVCMIGFALIMFGLGKDNTALTHIGFCAVVLSMIWSPIKTFVIDKMKK